MNLQKSKNLLETLEQAGLVLKSLKSNYKEMQDAIVTTPTAILDSLSVNFDPNQELEIALKIFQNLIELIEKVEKSVLHMENLPKNQNDAMVMLSESYQNMSANLNYLRKFKKYRQIEKYILLAQRTQTEIYEKVEKMFFKALKSNENDNLNVISQFLIDSGDKSEIIDKYIKLSVKSVNYEQYLKDKGLFINKIKNYKKDIDKIHSMNAFLFDSKITEFLDKNLLKIINENIKTDLLKFIQSCDSSNTSLLYFLRVYKLSKEMKIEILTSIHLFLTKFLDEIDEQEAIQNKFGPEEIVYFAQSLHKEFEKEFISDYIREYGNNLNVSNKSEFYDKILLTILSKIKHLCHDVDELNRFAYLIANIYEISQIKKNIADTSLYDEISDYKSKMYEIIKHLSFSSAKQLNQYVDSLLKQIHTWKIKNEIKSGIIAHIKKHLLKQAKLYKCEGQVTQKFESVE